MIQRLIGTGGSIVICLCAIGYAGEVRAQARVLNLNPECPACRIVPEVVAVLGTDTGPGMLPGEPVNVARDHAGRYWIAFNPPEVPIVFERDGTPLGPVGRRGEGPGEFRDAMALTPIADSMVVFDSQLGRASIFGPNLTVTRTVRLPGQVWSAVALAWPWLALNMPTRNPSAGGSYRLFDLESGTLSAGFGPSWEGAPMGQLGYVANSGRTERFWVAGSLALRLSEWGLNATRTADLAATPPWFPDGVQGRQGGPDQPPDPAILGISHRHGEQLWMVLKVPNPRWRDAWSRPGGRTPHGGSAMPDPLALWQARVLLIDTEKQRVLAMEDRNWWVISSLPGDEIALYDETDPMVPKVRIVRLSVHGS